MTEYQEEAEAEEEEKKIKENKSKQTQVACIEWYRFENDDWRGQRDYTI